MQQYVIDFLEREHLLQLGTMHQQVPRVVSLYYISDDRGRLFFLSELETRHSRGIVASHEVGFALARYDPTNFDNRKGVQGTGICEMIDRDESVMRAYCKKFGRNYLLLKTYMKTINRDLKLWKISPTMMKYRDDDLLGEEGTEIIRFAGKENMS